jgi:hypothetical protein
MPMRATPSYTDSYEQESPLMKQGRGQEVFMNKAAVVTVELRESDKLS